MPILYLARFLEIPKSTARDYIQLAKKEGFINSNQFFADFKLEPGEYHFYKKYGYPDESIKIRKRHGINVEQMPNKISSKIILKSKSKQNKGSSDDKKKSVPNN